MIKKWNTALVENLEWQTKYISDTLYLKMLSERLNLINKNINEGDTREYFIQKIGVKAITKETIIIYVTDVHDEYIYLINNGLLCIYTISKGDWTLIKEKKCPPEIRSEVENQLVFIDSCTGGSFELPLFSEISITHFYSENQIKATYLVKICKQHIELLNRLDAY